MLSKIYKTSIVGESWVNLGVNFLLMLFHSKEKQGGEEGVSTTTLKCAQKICNTF